MTGRRAIILTYHRIADEACDPWSLCVPVDRFTEQLEVLKARAAVLRLADLNHWLSAADGAGVGAVLTFDDGYADNVTNAKPVLERLEVPATFFIVSGGTGRDVEFWWDELDRILLQPGVLPDVFDMEIAGSRVHVSLGDASLLTPATAATLRWWRAWDPAPTPRHELYYALWKQMRPMSAFAQERVLDDLRLWARMDRIGRALRRTMTVNELVEAGNSPLIEVGGHTVTHPRLSSQRTLDQQNEIEGCRAALEEAIGRPVRQFSYPYGGPDDYLPETVALVREAGFDVACANSPGLVTGASDSLQLPRVPVENWNADEFEKRLIGWMTGA